MGEHESMRFLRNVTGFEAIVKEVDFGACVSRLIATGAPRLREPTYGIKVLALSLRVPLRHADGSNAQSEMGNPTHNARAR